MRSMWSHYRCTCCTCFSLYTVHLRFHFAIDSFLCESIWTNFPRTTRDFEDSGVPISSSFTPHPWRPANRSPNFGKRFSYNHPHLGEFPTGGIRSLLPCPAINCQYKITITTPNRHHHNASIGRIPEQNGNKHWVHHMINTEHRWNPPKDLATLSGINVEKSPSLMFIKLRPSETNLFPKGWWKMVMNSMGSNPYKNHLMPFTSKHILIKITDFPANDVSGPQNVSDMCFQEPRDGCSTVKKVGYYKPIWHHNQP